MENITSTIDITAENIRIFITFARKYLFNEQYSQKAVEEFVKKNRLIRLHINPKK